MKLYNILLFFPCLFLVGCASQSSDIQTFSGVPSIIVYENDNPYLKNNYSTFSSPALDTIPDETCGIAWYTVDYQNQPSTPPPFSANLTYWETIPQSPFQLMSGEMNDIYKDTMLSVNPVSLLNQFIFLSIESDNTLNYELLCNIDSLDKNNITNMYLRAKSDSQNKDSLSTDIETIAVFNIYPFIYEQVLQGKDTISFNIQYASKTDSVGNILYSGIKQNPFKIILK